IPVQFDHTLGAHSPFGFYIIHSPLELLRQVKPKPKTDRSMAPKRKPSSTISIGDSSNPRIQGNCEITVDANRFTCNSDSDGVVISIPRSGKIKVSAVAANHGNASEDFRSADKEHEFVLVNPKDVDGISKSYLQEVLQMYMIELPGMNYAANTGKQSKFLERCVTNGKYRTLLMKFASGGNSGKVIAAITYQIIPADTEYAEIPLAAVNAIYQRKGFGHLLFLELRKRLQSVGIRSIFCWGDKESEGFWLKQGFVEIAQVDTKGRARRLPVKADIRKSLCFPGGSTLMVCHLRKEADDANTVKYLPSQFHQNSFTSAIGEDEQLEFSGRLHIDLKFPEKSSHRTESDKSQHEALVKDGSSTEYDKLSGFDSHNPKQCCSGVAPVARVNDDRQATGAESSQDGVDANVKYCSQSTKGAKRAWEASLSSLKSKRVKGSQLVDYQSDSSCGFISETDKANPCFEEVPHDPSITKCSEKCIGDYFHLEAPINIELPSTKQCFRIMLMNIADDAKKTQLTKVIEDLGGTISYDGSMTTHVVTGQARKTLNFCTALCSGAWVISSSWLKESFREGRFVGKVEQTFLSISNNYYSDELPHILNDTDYLLKYKSDLKSAVFRAKASPHALFKGYNICIAAHVQTPAKLLSAIVRSAGGNVISGLKKVNEASTTIFVTCEEDTEEAMIAAKKGIRTFSSEWFMNCVMRQELDLEASQFAESL
ncbi:Mediator of DNA damage checkpoint protein 1, partial [Mucuna pruriens]